MSSASPSPLAVGDRVRERDRVGDDVIAPSSPAYAKVRPLLGQRRYGQVVGLSVRRASNGARLSYAQVLWDHRQSPSEHAFCRLERVAPPAP
jgi:hypothetical protein